MKDEENNRSENVIEKQRTKDKEEYREETKKKEREEKRRVDVGLDIGRGGKEKK